MLSIETDAKNAGQLPQNFTNQEPIIRQLILD